MSIDMSWTVWMRLNSATLAWNIIPFQAMSIFCRVSKECYTPSLQMMVTYMDSQANIYRLISTNF